MGDWVVVPAGNFYFHVCILLELSKASLQYFGDQKKQ